MTDDGATLFVYVTIYAAIRREEQYWACPLIKPFCVVDQFRHGSVLSQQKKGQPEHLNCAVDDL